MSPPLTSRNPDLARIVQDGYELAILHNHLVISGVPYVNSKGEVRLGTVVSDMSSISGDVTASPIQQHVAMWAGEYPCDSNGKPLEHMRHVTGDQPIGPGLTVNHSFSKKPRDGYRDYHHKMTTYVDMIERHARELDPNVTARVLERIRTRSDEQDELAALTAREREILTFIAEGLTNRQIGEQMFLAEKTVKNYISNMFAKLGMSRRTEAAAYATRLAERRAREQRD